MREFGVILCLAGIWITTLILNSNLKQLRQCNFKCDRKTACYMAMSFVIMFSAQAIFTQYLIWYFTSKV